MLIGGATRDVATVSGLETPCIDHSVSRLPWDDGQEKASRQHNRPASSHCSNGGNLVHSLGDEQNFAVPPNGSIWSIAVSWNWLNGNLYFSKLHGIAVQLHILSLLTFSEDFFVKIRSERFDLRWTQTYRQWTNATRSKTRKQKRLIIGYTQTVGLLYSCLQVDHGQSCLIWLLILSFSVSFLCQFAVTLSKYWGVNPST